MKEFFKNVLASALGTFAAGIIAGFALLILLVALVSSASMHAEKSTVTVKNKTILVIGNGIIVNDTPSHGSPSFERLLGSDHSVEVDLWRAVESIKLASKDQAIVGILIAGEVEAGYVQLAEIRQALQAYKKSGKPLIAWVENASQREYYLVSVADKIYQHPAGELEFKGLETYNFYFGETLKKIGVGVQVTKVGKYKSAVEPYLGDKMSEPSREQTEAVLRGAWKKITAEVASSRGLTVGTLNQYANSSGIFSASEALKLNLVDQLMQRDELIAKMQKIGAKAEEGETSFRQVSLFNYSSKAKLPHKGGRIAVVYAEGEIVDGWGADNEVGGDQLAHDLRTLRNDDKLKAVVLRINSPGGSAFASDLVAREVGLLKAKGVPVIVSMGDVSASGGYYIAAPANLIVADAMTITGSIGVFGLHFNYSELATKLSLATDGVKTSRYSDLLNSHRPATPEELNIVQNLVDGVYDDFLQVVSTGRKMKKDGVHEIAQGRVWLGADAREIGLVDRIGGLHDAIQIARGMAKLDEAEIIQVPSLYSGRENIIQKLVAGDESDQPLFARVNTKSPALSFIKAHLDMLKKVQSLNDPKGIYLTCPVQLNNR